MESRSFLSSPFKIQSPQIGEKIRMKSEKNIWTKLPPPSLTFLAFLFSFFFWLFLSLVTLAFCFCFCFCFFLFSFFGFVRTWWVLLLFLLFLKFLFLLFFKKTLFGWFLCYFLKCSLSSIHNFKKKSIMYYFLFYLRGT